jgi:hypothetical protein
MLYVHTIFPSVLLEARSINAEDREPLVYVCNKYIIICERGVKNIISKAVPFCIPCSSYISNGSTHEISY